jgi:hypothetical protein
MNCLPIFIISIPSSKYRLGNVLTKLSSSENLAGIINKAPGVFTIKWKGVKYGYYDQYKKYIYVFRKIVKLDKPCLVLEDDALAKEGWEIVLESAPKGYDFLFLSDDHFKHPLHKIDDHWFECCWSKTTCATVFSPKAAKALLKWQFICKHPMDWTINYLLMGKNEFKSYWHVPGVFEHGTKKGFYSSTI